MIHAYCQKFHQHNMVEVVKDFIGNNQVRLRVFVRFQKKEWSTKHCVSNNSFDNKTPTVTLNTQQ